MSKSTGLSLLTTKNSIIHNPKLRDLSAKGMWKYTSIVVDLIFMLGVINNLLVKGKKTTYNGKVEETGIVFTGAIGTGTMDDLKDTLQSLIFALFNQEHAGMVDKYSTVIFPFLIVYFFLQRTTYIYICLHKHYFHLW